MCPIRHTTHLCIEGEQLQWNRSVNNAREINYKKMFRTYFPYYDGSLSNYLELVKSIRSSISALCIICCLCRFDSLPTQSSCARGPAAAASPRWAATTRPRSGSG
jgi:hypothetical protein